MDEFSLDIPSQIDLRVSGNFRIRSDVKFSANTERRILRLIDTLKSNNRGASDFSKLLDIALREAISANIWRTRNGVDDIIDSGDLLRSSRLTVLSNGKISISYDVPYAALIHYGGYIVPYGNSNASRVYIPPRPWVSSVLAGQVGNFDPVNIYKDIIVRILQSF